MSNERIHEIIDGNLILLHQLIDQICFINGPIDCLYISIGGKLNSSTVSFNNNDETKRKQQRTNSLYQMLPSFIQSDFDKENIVVIVIDDFSKIESRMSSKKLLDLFVCENTNVILFDKLCDKSFLTKLVDLFVTLCEEYQIPKKDSYICNFVRHINMPNTIEYAAEENIPKVIQRLLDTEYDKKYSGCFYQWFGYRYHSYNYIYKYDKHNLYELKNFTVLFENVLDGKNVEFLENQDFLEFLENTLDLTEFYRK